MITNQVSYHTSYLLPIIDSQNNSICYLIIISEKHPEFRMKQNTLHQNLGQGFMNNKRTIEIYFRTLMGKGDKFTLQPASTIESLSNLIAKILKVQATNIELFNQGRNLKRKQLSLQQYGLKDGSIVHVQQFDQHRKRTKNSLPQQYHSHNNQFERYSQNVREVAIFLKIKAQNFQIPLSNQKTVRNLKQEVQARSDFKADYLCLSHLGKQMIDENTLQQSGIYSSAWISGQYLQPPIKHQNRLANVFNGNIAQSDNLITTEMFENAEEIQINDEEQDNQQYLFMKDDNPIQSSGDIKNMINNIKLSQSVEILSPNANKQISYQYFDDFSNSKFWKKSGLFSQSGVKSQSKIIENSQQQTNKVQVQIKKFQGNCQIKLSNPEDNMIYTIDCQNSSYRTSQLKKLLQKLEAARQNKKEIMLLNPKNQKPLTKDIQMCQLPWQSTILNRVLYVNFTFTDKKEENLASE